MLKGLKILDFTRLLPGPFATKILADLGAEILSVEHPTKPDLIKSYGPKKNGVSTLYHTLNHHKKTIQLDLKEVTAQNKVKGLIEEYDIIIEGFRPGVMESFGLDYDSLRERNPELIYCSLTGYGQTTDNKDKAGHDINYLALSGIPSYSGRDQPPILGTQIADLSGSLYASNSILAAVINRKHSGKGVFLDVSMYETVLSLGIIANNEYLNGSKVSSRGDSLLNGGTVYDYYETLDGRYLAIGSLEPKFLTKVLATLNIETNLDIFDTALKETITAKIRTKSLQEWIPIFEAIDACVEPVKTVDEVFEEGSIIQEVEGIKSTRFPVRITQDES